MGAHNVQTAVVYVIIGIVVIKFRSSADKHGVPRRSTWRVALIGQGRDVITNEGGPGTEYVGLDDRGVELEVVTVQEGPCRQRTDIEESNDGHNDSTEDDGSRG